MYHQLTAEERYTIAILLQQGKSQAFIARYLNRSPSTISRELNRNRRKDGKYEAKRAIQRTSRIRRESRRRWYFSDLELQIVISLLRQDWSPEQIALWLKDQGVFSISHSTIYRYVWYDRCFGGQLFNHLRQAGKKRRKQYKGADSRGILANKAHISERPISAENRSRIGHWEIDTVFGGRDHHCIVTLVERKTRYTIIGKLANKSKEALNQKVIELINRETRSFKTITADNGTEFHGYSTIEKTTGVKFYFANPYHSWERGLNENTNGLIRQYLPKGKTMQGITQKDCDKIAQKLNRRPRKCLNMKTPEQVYAKSTK